MDAEFMENLIFKAEALIEALPYMQLFSGKYFVVKYGGQAMVSDEMMATVVADIVLLKHIGIKPVLVHGGGKEVNEMMRRLGKEPRFVGGLRVTDDETMEIVEMVLLGKVNRHIVALLNRCGARAVGLSGGDAGLFQARVKPFSPGGSSGKDVDLGRVGEINWVDISLIETLSENDYIPVVSSIGADSSWESLNINADHAAGELAGALQAEKLIILTDVEGIYQRTEKGTRFISAIKEKEIRTLIRDGQINGGMIPKVEACLRALEQGVARTHIIDGRRKHALILEIFTDAGIGTMVTL
ncbi:MAG TPA: acetylglutamate kinase [Bacillota bacterium]|jgi:acetylglutamate kinase|nr:acetylglutamate kinase [Bacillota bacterium]HOB28801.1 acetylglutamate kinase [Bacillota bacterium]HPZ42161.1 acetylglutamate kinase [Bacillota bacterium]HQD53097.1 acetylglutamate kinase [Bacillota bacterium]